MSNTWLLWSSCICKIRLKKLRRKHSSLKYTTESLLFENLNKHFPQIDARMWKIFYHECFFVSYCIELVKKKKKLGRKGEEGAWSVHAISLPLKTVILAIKASIWHIVS